MAEEQTPATEPEPSVYFSLRPKYQRFVDAIVAGKTGADAMREIGDTRKRPEQAAWKLRRQKDVGKAIAERQAQAAMDAGISPARILLRVNDVVERCMQAVEVRDREGNPIGEFEFDSRGALIGLEMLGKYHKMWTDKHEHMGANGAPLAPPVINIGFTNGGPGTAAAD